jgi:hypothetical protein
MFFFFSFEQEIAPGTEGYGGGGPDGYGGGGGGGMIIGANTFNTVQAQLRQIRSEGLAPPPPPPLSTSQDFPLAGNERNLHIQIYLPF